ncbi:MAG: hypothetical protein NZ108_05590, partial [Bacteroidia bacterium]|nr:hypothetical protein [Bacteroidia bacterium]
MQATPGYNQYNWSSGQTTSSITVSSAGTYVVTVTDVNGCSATTSQIVTVVPNPTPSVTPAGPLNLCIGSSVTLHATVNNNYLNYAWNGINGTDSLVVTTTGVYAVTVTDIYGCVGISDSVSVVFTTTLNPTITASAPVACYLDSVLLVAQPGYATYTWLPSGQSNDSIYVTPGSYSVQVSDFSGCTGVSNPIQIQPSPINPQQIQITTTPTVICEGDSSILSVTPSNLGNYVWSTGATGPSLTVYSDTIMY